MVNNLRQVRDCLNSHEPSFFAQGAERLFTGERGRPKLNLAKEQLAKQLQNTGPL